MLLVDEGQMVQHHLPDNLVNCCKMNRDNTWILKHIIYFSNV